MAFDTIIANGRVVTATDTYASDVAISNGKITALGQNLPRDNATKIIDAAGKYVLPGGIDVHTHLDMPFGSTISADDFETGTRAAAFGGTTTLIDFAIQYKGQTLRTAFDTWMKKSISQSCRRLRVPLHHHRSTRRATRRNDRSHPRRRHQLQALHGLPGRIHARRREHFQGIPRHRKKRRPGLHARRKWQRHRRNRAASFSRREKSSEISRVDTPNHCRSRGHIPRHRPCRNGRSPGLHRALKL